MQSNSAKLDTDTENGGFAFERQVMQNLQMKDVDPKQSTKENGNKEILSSDGSLQSPEKITQTNGPGSNQILIIQPHEEGRQLSQITDVSYEDSHDNAAQVKTKIRPELAAPNPKTSAFQRKHLRSKTSSTPEKFSRGGKSPERNLSKQNSKGEFSNRLTKNPSYDNLGTNSVDYNRQETEGRSPLSHRNSSPRKKPDYSFRVPYSEQRKTMSIPLSPSKSDSPEEGREEEVPRSSLSPRVSSSTVASPSRPKMAKSKLVSSVDIEKLLVEITPEQLKVIFPHVHLKVEEEVKRINEEVPKEKPLKNLEKERLKKLPLKPFMNEKSNKHIKAALIDCMVSFGQKKREEIELLKKETDPRREEELINEFDLRSPGRPERISLLEDKIIKEMTSPRQTVSKVTERLSKKVIEKTSPNVLERFRIYQEKIEENLRQKEKQAELQLNEQRKAKTRTNVNIQKAQGNKVNGHVEAKNERNEIKQKAEGNLNNARTNSAKARVSSQSAGGNKDQVFTSPRNPVRESCGSTPSVQVKRKQLAVQKFSSPAASNRRSEGNQKVSGSKTQIKEKHGKKNKQVVHHPNGTENLKEGVEKIHQKIQKIQQGLAKLQFTLKSELMKGGEECSSFLEKEELPSSDLESQVRSPDDASPGHDSLDNSRISSYSSNGALTKREQENNSEQKKPQGALKLPIQAGKDSNPINKGISAYNTPIKNAGLGNSKKTPQQPRSAKSSEKIKNFSNLAPKKLFALELSKVKFNSPSTSRRGNH